LRLISCENLVCDRKEFIFDTFIYSEPVKRSKNRSDVTRFWGYGDSTSKRIDTIRDMIRYGRLTCTQKLTRWRA